FSLDNVRPTRHSHSPYTTLFRSDEAGRPALRGDQGHALRLTHARGEHGHLVAGRERRHLGLDPVPAGELDRAAARDGDAPEVASDRKSTRLNSSHVKISYAVFCL